MIRVFNQRTQNNYFYSIDIVDGNPEKAIFYAYMHAMGKSELKRDYDQVYEERKHLLGYGPDREGIQTVHYNDFAAQIKAKE